MTEDEAKDWIVSHFGADALTRLARLVSLVVEEARRQNLVAPATLPTIWTRHVVDSAQLVPLAPAKGTWLDIGTGAGFPGLVVAALRPAHMILVEPRRLRAAFLAQAAQALALPRVEVLQMTVEDMARPAAVISARAVAPVEKLLHAASACSNDTTRWLLPRGRSGASDVQQLSRAWSGAFHVEQSVTDPGSHILLLDNVSLRRTCR